MRIRIIPDLHGSDWWKEEIKDIDELDHCIFLGDYVDDWDAENEVIFKNLEEIISFKKNIWTRLLFYMVIMNLITFIHILDIVVVSDLL